MLDFEALRTPAEDGQVLIEPPPERLVELVERNRKLLGSSQVRLGGMELAELRHRVRAGLTDEPAGPLIVTGHQPEFFHPGVWAKYVAADCLAGRVGGRVLHLVADHDVPKRASLAVPVCTAGRLQVQELTLPGVDRRLAYEELPAVGRAELAQLEQALAAALQERWGACVMPLFLVGFARAAPDEGLVGQMVAGRRAIDEAYGLCLADHRASRVWGGAVLADMIANGERFAACYNRALAEYRRARGIRGSTRPVPDLARDGGRVELPLWTWVRGQPRRRLFVERRGDRVSLYASDELIGQLDARGLERWETAQDALAGLVGWCLRPRAIALTLWARLVLADVFVHGIGGAKYDRITDGLMRLYYGVRPPGMICVSATLRLPLPRYEVTLEDLRRVAAQVRDFRYNPDRYLPRPEAARELLDRRKEAIARSDWLRAREPENHRARRETFQAIRQLNAAICALAPQVQRDLAERVRTLERQLAHNRRADSREYFVGLFPRAKLAELAGRVREAIMRGAGRRVCAGS